ncbi:fungal-specific transcription factor domain-containing protein [Trichoderma ceciliae]
MDASCVPAISLRFDNSYLSDFENVHRPLLSPYWCSSYFHVGMELSVPTPRRREAVNCFNCSASQRSCDRTRHRCDTCAKNSELCQGYPRELQWLTGVTSRGKQKGRSISIDASNTDWESTTPTNHTFIFKPGRPQKKCKHEIRALKQQWSTGSTPQQPQAILESKRHVSHQPSVPVELSQDYGAMLEDISDVDSSTVLRSIFDSSDSQCQRSVPYNDDGSSATSIPSTSPAFTWQETYDFTSDNGLLLCLLEAFPKLDPPSLISQPQFGSSQLLAFYDTELCTLPLTFDFSANPFRCMTDSSHGPQYLIHALLAFSIQHVSRLGNGTCKESTDQQIAAYKYSATDLCAMALLIAPASTKNFVLDTILVLFALDTLTSAVGPWNMRLVDAYNKIESIGGVNAISSSSRFQAQIAMFVWWDCSISLISRSNPVFPSSYYDFVLSCDDTSWNIFTISGVPRQLFQYFRELIHLASEKEQISGLKYANFDLRRVNELERCIQEYSEDKFNICDTYADEEVVQNWYDYYHACNTWKYALLLYISRVFKWDRTSSNPVAEILSLSRLLLDSARCCRPESSLQKQFLIPIFLAGSETIGAYSRNFVKDYCEGWYRKSRYSMFMEAADLLTEIWAQRDGQNNEFKIWWGSLVGIRQPNAPEFLFG